MTKQEKMTSKTWHQSLLLIFISLTVFQGHACTPPKADYLKPEGVPTYIEQAFHKSSTVVLALATRVIQQKKRRFQDEFDQVESVDFVVLLSFKGKKFTGDTLTSRTDLRYGCVASTYNRPAWLEAPGPAPVPLKPAAGATPVPLSGTWLLYTNMNTLVLTPWPNRPLELMSGADLLQLIRLSQADRSSP